MGSIKAIEWHEHHGGVAIEVQNMQPGERVLRVERDFSTSPIRGYNADVVGGVGVVFDFETRIGDTVNYGIGRVGDSVTQLVGGLSIAVPGNQAWLRDMDRPEDSMRVIVVDTGDEQRPVRQSVYEVSGRPNPVVVYDVRSGRRGRVTLLLPNRWERERLEKLCDQGEPLLLNVCSSKVWAPCYMAVGDLTFSRYGSKDAFLAYLDYIEVDAAVELDDETEVILPPDPSFDEVKAMVNGTFIDMSAMFPTFIDVLLGRGQTP